jgi:AraC family transcriptional regulator
MCAQRITAIMGGEITPLGADPPLLSSTAANWSGFLLEEHAITAPRDEIGWSWHSTHVGVCTAGSSVIRIRGAAGNSRSLVRPGGVFLFPGGCDRTTIHHSGGDNRFIVVELDTALLERLFQGEDYRQQRQLLAQINLNDPQIAALLSNMHMEIKNGGRAGSLYHESLSLALATYLAHHYAAPAPAPVTAMAGTRFSGTQRRRVLDYIQTHLGRKFSLLELAAVLQLGPRHFSRLFRNTFGVAPYRYVVNERIRQARVLLATPRLSIVEIAASLGFASQSHFTDVFHKATGVSPGRYRQQC